MDFGLQVSYFSWPGAPASIGPAFGRIARNAEDAGLTSLWVMDHFFQISMIGPPELDMLEGYSALAYAAALTSRIELGTLVTGVTYRHPGVLAKTAAAKAHLDVIEAHCADLGRDPGQIRKTVLSRLALGPAGGTTPSGEPNSSVDEAVERYGRQREIGIDTVILGMPNDTDNAAYPLVAELVRQLA